MLKKFSLTFKKIEHRRKLKLSLEQTRLDSGKEWGSRKLLQHYGLLLKEG